ICDSTGDIQERYTYNAFGKRNVFDVDFATKNETEFNWNRAFTGQILDSETGLMLYRNRYYSTELGRFINRDPIGYEGRDINLFRYVYNIPLLAVDSTGQWFTIVIPLLPIIVDVIVDTVIIVATAVAITIATTTIIEAINKPKPTDECDAKFTACLGSSLQSVPGGAYGTSRCMDCRDECKRQGGIWPVSFCRYGKTIDCSF
ncbi:MAG: RHS repeat-associated core domain-containing protein, partial [Bacteroidales bacterium]|nr:RHS repeat-associated core domain-containing protein [Bacteroidales bacterium]